MATSRSQTVRQSLQLSIDPSPYNPQQLLLSPDSNSPSSSVREASAGTAGTAGTTPTSGGSDYTMYSVLCLWDFESNDPDHLPFSKNEILDIVREEDTGWWAAMRKGVFQVGWIPKAFVKPLSYEMTERLRNVREELRVFEYEAEQLYNSAPIANLTYLYDSVPESSPSPTSGWVEPNGVRKGQTLQLGADPAPSRVPRSLSSNETDLQFTTVESQRLAADNRSRPCPPPSPSTPMPQPPSHTAPAICNKPTPPTPTDSLEEDAGEFQRSRSDSSPSTTRDRSMRRRPMLVNDKPSLSRLSTLIESTNPRDIKMLASPEVTGSFDALAKKTRADKIKQLTGSDDALEFHNAVQAQVNLPWYIRPTYSDQLQLDNDGHIRAGTLRALVERLSSDPLSKEPMRAAQETQFRNIFLMTFRTFTTADVLFDILVERYRMDHPNNLNDTEFEEWKEKKLLPTQRQVLTILTMWLEDHRLLEEEPHIAQRLTEFLALIVAPAPLAMTAKLMVQSIERLTFANPATSCPVNLRKRRKSKGHKNELLKLDPTNVAEQLCLLEHKLYAKVAPQECIAYAKTQAGKPVENLSAFCGTHDKLASWVKMSILNHETLGKRADTVDFWIKVAEKCRNLNNFASMSALINALSSTVITRLHLTWAHVGRKSNLDALLKHNEPTGGFSGYRSLIQNVEGSCVPFVGMYLTDIVHIQDQFSDETISTPTNPREPLICFLQRQRWYEVVSVMLRYQSKPYNIAESESTLSFISGHLRSGSLKDQGWFWTRSQEVQQLELAHADIRRGLEAAGF